MSGHSKWSQIKHKKGISDQKKGQLFSKLGKAIAVAAKEGGPDPKANIKLKGLIETARSLNMPNNTIERAIKKAGEKDAAQLHEFKVEVMGPGNVSLIVVGITDNTNRTIGEIKTIAARHGGKMVAEGSFSWMFRREIASEGIIWSVPVEYRLTPDAEILAQARILIDALDDNEDVQEIYSNFADESKE
ncbi:MAG: hypothetical protein A2750_01540 [Candidatus Yanofskybacteria bacterium RIFCSPHIGHO2_01_FULL_45_42]|uniref:Transcriptional regulator n=2 Tax=Candidatus Yanofskyibacteriota TaxID=1752733 RepID=A0A1F8F3U1_9BACT|nr:MAG: hypothetical protein A2750_01540 [Candidatus Yanofskybacteria bacterium RIFCSPHIGHO2_01_FULL_45_42]OGN31974.1 MAG: hypothetical protein A3J01_02755 [Candidatus Yanofskybacteria bacterium RIFCSPLOWO2_02_FULL_45_18]